MPTAQTNTTLAEIATRFSELDNFVICGHVNPDGDCLGSQLGLMHALRALGKTATCLLAKPDSIDAGLRFLPGVDEMVVASEYTGPCEVFVAVDVPTIERIGSAAPLHKQARVRFTIDHHAVPTCMAEYNYVDPEAPAAAMLIWELAHMLGGVSATVALCTLTGVITDTGRFAYQNTTPAAFKAASEMMAAGASPALVNREFFQNRSLASMELEQRLLSRMVLAEQGAFVYSYLDAQDFAEAGATKADAEALIDVLRSISGVRVALILRRTDAESAEVRGSLRAKDDYTDVAQVARVYDGGGHVAAAGFTFHGTMAQALAAVPQTVHELCFAGTAPSANQGGAPHHG